MDVSPELPEPPDEPAVLVVPEPPLLPFPPVVLELPDAPVLVVLLPVLVPAVDVVPVPVPVPVPVDEGAVLVAPDELLPVLVVSLPPVV